MRTSVIVLFGLALSSCRRDTPMVKQDPVAAPTDAGGGRAHEPFLIHGKVIDLATFKVVHQLTKERPLDEQTAGEYGWLAVRHSVVEAYDLRTGKRVVTTKARCGNLAVWGQRIVCRQDDTTFILDRDGGASTLELAGPGVDFVGLATRLLVHRLSGSVDFYGPDGAHLASHPPTDGFANVVADGDGYCLLGANDLECRKPDGTRRFKAEINPAMPSGTAIIARNDYSGTAVMVSRTAGTASSSQVTRIRDGKVIGKATPAANVLVGREDGEPAAMLRLGASGLELLELDGRVRWTSSAKRTPRQAFEWNESIILADNGSVTALGAKDGSLLWERALEPFSGVAELAYWRLRKGLLFIRSRDTAVSRLQIVDPKTGEIRFVDAM